MAIEIKVNPELLADETPVQARELINIRRTLNNDLIMSDHPDIDVIVSPKNNKVLAIAKDEFGDHVYASASRLFDYLGKRGVVQLETIHAGNIYGSLEAMLPENDEVDPIQVAVYVINEFLKEEVPYYTRNDELERELEKNLLEPDDEDSTELGEIPHDPLKGTLHRWPGSSGAYMHHGMYRQ